MNQIKIMLACVAITLSIHSQAQTNTVTTGADASGSGGSISYSIGQIDYIAATGAGGSISQGVQQVYKLTVNLKYFIEGYYEGAGLMKPVLSNQGQPNGVTDVDTVTIELHQPSSPYALAHSYTGILQTNGTMTCAFPNASEGQSYYIVIKHRNTLETWSANPVTLSNSVYDFSSGANKAYGDNQVLIDANTYALFSGDIIKDENIDLLDLTVVEIDISNFEYGYIASDINGDGNVDLLDSPTVEGNVNNFVFSLHP